MLAMYILTYLTIKLLTWPVAMLAIATCTLNTN